MKTKEAIRLNNKEWNEKIFNNYTHNSNYTQMVKILNSSKKRDIKTLIKAMQNLNKKIRKLKSQEIFLNELLDKREEEIKELKQFVLSKDEVVEEEK